MGVSSVTLSETSEEANVTKEGWLMDEDEREKDLKVKGEIEGVKFVERVKFERLERVEWGLMREESEWERVEDAIVEQKQRSIEIEVGK